MHTDLEWFHPSGNTGLIQNYTLRAYDLQRDNITVTTTFYDSTTLSGGLSVSLFPVITPKSGPITY